VICSGLVRGDHLCYGEWLLKNSFAEVALKTRSARMPYKRCSPTGDTFLVTQFEADFGKWDFFQQPRDIATVIYRPPRPISLHQCACKRVWHGLAVWYES
jgi:hypothetical protein